MLARHHDPIVAIATAPGRGAVGIVRVSGKGLAARVQHYSPADPEKAFAEYRDATCSGAENHFQETIF